jgi:hypothetical protein
MSGSGGADIGRRVGLCGRIACMTCWIMYGSSSGTRGSTLIGSVGFMGLLGKSKAAALWTFNTPKTFNYQYPNDKLS